VRSGDRRLFKAADAVACISVAERDLVIKDFPSVAERAVTIPSGTDPNRPGSYESWLELDEPVVLTVGCVERYKKVDLISQVDGLASGARVAASDIPEHVALARLAGVDAVVLVDPRDTSRFTGLLAASLVADPIPAGDLKLPSWADVVADTRELYSRVRLGHGPANRRCPPDMAKLPRLPDLPRAAEPAPREPA
jgi:hypothetical protein